MNSSDFQFSTPILTNLEFSLNNNFVPSESIEMPIESEIKVSEAKDNKKAIVTIELTIGQKNETFPFAIQIEMCSTFFWETDIDDKEIDRLLHENAPALLLSYMRPIISLVTSSSPYPTYNLPFMDLTNHKTEGKKEI